MNRIFYHEAHLGRIPIGTMIRIDVLSISFKNNDRPCIVFDDDRADSDNHCNERWNIKSINCTTKVHQMTSCDESIQSEYSKASVTLSSNSNRTSDHCHTMRRLYRNLKSRNDKFGRGRRRCNNDKLQEPDSKFTIIEEPKCSNDHDTLHINAPNRNISFTLERRVNDGIFKPWSDNVSDEILCFSTKEQMDERINHSIVCHDSSDIAIQDMDDDTEEEESLIGLQFLTDDYDDTDDRGTNDDGQNDMQQLFFTPSNVDKSFCLSSDSDECSTETVDTVSGVSDSTRISYGP